MKLQHFKTMYINPLIVKSFINYFSCSYDSPNYAHSSNVHVNIRTCALGDPGASSLIVCSLRFALFTFQVLIPTPFFGLDNAFVLLLEETPKNVYC